MRAVPVGQEDFARIADSSEPPKFPTLADASTWVTAVVERLPEQPPNGLSGRGIVICAGGLRYLTCAWVCINMLRRLGCKLPIELWHLGREEVPTSASDLFRPLGVTTVDGLSVQHRHPTRTLKGWELKPYAILHSSFAEVLSLDADNVPIVDPTFLFEADQYRSTGAIFWPDYGRLAPDRSIWSLMGVSHRDEPEFESGQIVVDKRRCWRGLSLTMALNEYSDFWYQHIHGDKETFHMAWRRLDLPYSMPPREIEPLDGVMCQHDFSGRRIFQHRNLKKWVIEGNPRVNGFEFEDECLEFIRSLRPVLRSLVTFPETVASVAPSTSFGTVADGLIGQPWLYRRVGHDERVMSFAESGSIQAGAGLLEQLWRLWRLEGRTVLDLCDNRSLTARLTLGPDGVWRGRWCRFEGMPIELVPLLEGYANELHEVRGDSRIDVARAIRREAERVPRTAIEIGPREKAGTNVDVDALFDGWRRVLFEPLLERFWNLSERYAGSSAVEVVNATISRTSGKGSLWSRPEALVPPLAKFERLGGAFGGHGTLNWFERYNEQSVRIMTAAEMMVRFKLENVGVLLLNAGRANLLIVRECLAAGIAPEILVIAADEWAGSVMNVLAEPYEMIGRDEHDWVWKRIRNTEQSGVAHFRSGV